MEEELQESNDGGDDEDPDSRPGEAPASQTPGAESEEEDTGKVPPPKPPREEDFPEGKFDL